MMPLLKLPIFAQEIIVNDLKMEDVVNLAMRSTKFKNFFDHVKYRVDSLQFFFGYFYTFIKIKKGKEEYNVEAFCLPIPGREMCWKTGKLNGESVEIFERREDTKVKCDDQIEMMGKITKHFMGMLKVKEFNMYCHKNYDFKNLFIWKYIKKFEYMEIRRSEERILEMTSEELEFLLENVTSKRVLLDFKVPNYKYKGVLKDSKIEILDSDWIDLDHFSIGPSTKFVTIRVSPIPYPAVNKFLKDWISGKYEKLEEVWFLNGGVRYDDSEMYEGTESIPTRLPKDVLKKRGIHSFSVAKSPPRDIKRVTDGLIATVSSHKYGIGMHT